VKANGKTGVIGKFTDVPRVAVMAIQQRRYRRISPEIYENYSNPNLEGGKNKGLSFRRISLLGADIPEIKTLADVVAFGEEPLKILFAEPQEDQMDQAAIEKLVKDAADAARAESDKKFKAFEESQKGAFDTMKAENEQLKKDNQSIAQAHAQGLLAQRSTTISAFIEVQKAAGRILPAWETAGLKKFMETLDDRKVLKFSEASDAKEMSPMSFFQEFLKGLPKVVRLSELTDDDLGKIAEEKNADKGDGDKLNVKLDLEVKKFIESEKKGGTVLSYAEALRAVTIAHPELVKSAQ
jgi:hypothetical protein